MQGIAEDSLDLLVGHRVIQTVAETDLQIAGNGVVHVDDQGLHRRIHRLGALVAHKLHCAVEVEAAVVSEDKILILTVVRVYIVTVDLADHFARGHVEVLRDIAVLDALVQS